MALKSYYLSRSPGLQFIYYGSVERITTNDHNEAVIEFDGVEPFAVSLDSKEYVDFMIGFQEYLESDEE